MQLDTQDTLAFVKSLRPHDASVAVALLELVRRADSNGSLPRGQWLAAISVALPGTGSATQPDAADTEVSRRYLDEHVIARLDDAGLASADPDDPERIRISPDIWGAISLQREAFLDQLEEAVSGFLDHERQADTTVAGVERGTEESGSTLVTEGLVKVYRKRRVVDDVNLRVVQGEIVGLLGPNGAGKTTTFYMMVGLVAPDRGRVFLDDRELTGVPMYARARLGLGYLAQEPSVFRKLTVEDNIRAILETMRLSRKERKERLETLLDELAIKHLRNARAYSLSGGERRRLEITRALVSNPKFMLLDEPFAGVDPIAVHDIQQIVAGLRDRGIGVIITDHNVEQTLDIVDRAHIMYDGRVRVSGTVAELVWNDEVADIYLGPTLTARMRERFQPPEAA